MKLPFPKIAAITPITVYIGSGMSEEGVETPTTTFVGKCYFTENGKTLRSPDGLSFASMSAAFIEGDIAPSEKTISGSALVRGKTYKVEYGKRASNPDGSVHHTELGLL